MPEPDHDLRRTWERRWATRRDEDFEWSLASDVAPQLRQVLAARRPWSGRALDIGCGAGAATAHLAAELDSAVGVDIAFAALQQASARSSSRSSFMAADALHLPFPTEAFALVFDRGCLQNLPRSAWPRYFDEVPRVLAEGGTLQLLVSRMTAHFPPIWTRLGLRRRWGWYVQRQRGGAQFLSHDLLWRLCPSPLRIEMLEDFDFVTRKGKTRRFTHALITKG